MLHAYVDDKRTEVHYEGDLFKITEYLQRLIVQIALEYDQEQRDDLLSMIAKSISDPELLEIIQGGIDTESIYIDCEAIDEIEQMVSDMISNNP